MAASCNRGQKTDAPARPDSQASASKPPMGSIRVSPGPAQHSLGHRWLWLLVSIFLAGGWYGLYERKAGSSQEISPVKNTTPVHASLHTVATIRRGDLPIYAWEIGMVKASNTVTVKAEVDGQLTSIKFLEGHFVCKGQVLATIDPRPYQQALAQAQAVLEQAQGVLVKDQAVFEDAQRTYARDQQLFQAKILAKQQLDSQGAVTDESRGFLAVDRGVIQTAQAAVHAAQLNWSDTKIRAPISGRISLGLVDAGNIVHAADSTGLAVITEVQPISVLFTVTEDQLPLLLNRLRQGRPIPVKAYSRNGATKLAEGTLEAVDNQIDGTTGTARVKAVFSNRNLALFPNQFVNVRLLLAVQRGAVLAPDAALQQGPAGSFVSLVRQDGTEVMRSVKTGPAAGKAVSIVQGLQPGDRVVLPSR